MSRLTASPPFGLRLAACALAAALLSACGGGGGGGGGDGSSATTAVTAAPPAMAIHPEVPAASYGDAERQTLYQQLNTVRLGAGAGVARQSAQLDQSAAAHLRYLQLNGVESGHTETTGQAGFTGTSIGARATSAGYPWRFVSEDLAWGTGFTPAQCLDLLLSSVYHLSSLLGEQRDMGVAFGAAKSTNAALTNIYGCVFNFGVVQSSELQLPARGTLRAYPYSGQTGVATSFTPSTEAPNPMPDYATRDKVAGQPVFVSLRAQGDTTATTYAVSGFTLRDATGNAVAARLIARGTMAEGVSLSPDPQSALNPGDVFLVPLSPLAAGSTYTVNFTGRNGSVPYAATWQFRTR